MLGCALRFTLADFGGLIPGRGHDRGQVVKVDRQAVYNIRGPAVPFRIPGVFDQFFLERAARSGTPEVPVDKTLPEMVGDFGPLSTRS
jgi:hypothetical protein